MEDENCFLEKDDIDVNEDKASRGIYVTGFPSNTTAIELVIHFQKRKHGGGDIECIHIQEKRYAVIIFDDPLVADDVSKTRQFLGPDEVPLTITQLRKSPLQNDIKQMRQALDDEKRTRDVRKQELKEKEKLLFSISEISLGEEQLERTRLEQELSHVKNAGNKRVKTLENQLRDTSRLCELKKVEVREKEAAVNNLQVLLEENQQEKSEIKNQLSQQQKSCIKLEERLKAEQVSSQSIKLQLEANELLIRELRLKVEQGREQRTALEETVRRQQLQFAEEKDRHASIERDLQLALSTTQAEVSELLRSGTCDWILLREEVTLGRKVLGKGAWGIVNEGMFRGCKVAVKKIHDLILSDHNRRSFEREMNIASRCRHPNLLQFIGATNDDGSPLFVTELLDTCLRRLLSERELTPKEVLNLTLDIARGLNYLHLNKPLPIIHRDISSANVLLWRRGECWRAKLSDYGAANFMRRCMTENKGAIIYSAPEAFTPKQSPKVDVYSFGVLLCEMCIREQPDPQDLPDQIKRVSDDTFRQLIQQCVEKKPGKRPTMAEVIPALEQC